MISGLKLIGKTFKIRNPFSGRIFPPRPSPLLFRHSNSPCTNLLSQAASFLFSFHFPGMLADFAECASSPATNASWPWGPAVRPLHPPLASLFAARQTTRTERQSTRPLSNPDGQRLFRSHLALSLARGAQSQGSSSTS